MIGYKSFPRVLQLTDYTCGPCCVHAITSHFEIDLSYNEVKEAIGTDENGTDEGPIVRFLRQHGFRVSPRSDMTWPECVRFLKSGSVVLVGLDGDHFGVLYGVNEKSAYLMDPSIRRQLRTSISIAKFKKRWMRGDGVAIRPRIFTGKNIGERSLWRSK